MSAQQPVEMILLRQLASYLRIPMWMMDADGNLLYYNEAAEQILGASFDDVGPIHAEDVADFFRASGLEDSETEMPVVRALTNRQPDHGRIRFRGLDDVWREVEITALPIEGQAGRLVGVLAAFWEIPS